MWRQCYNRFFQSGIIAAWAAWRFDFYTVKSLKSELLTPAAVAGVVMLDWASLELPLLPRPTLTLDLPDVMLVRQISLQSSRVRMMAAFYRTKPSRAKTEHTNTHTRNHSHRQWFTHKLLFRLRQSLVQLRKRLRRQEPFTTHSTTTHVHTS